MGQLACKIEDTPSDLQCGPIWDGNPPRYSEGNDRHARQCTAGPCSVRHRDAGRVSGNLVRVSRSIHSGGWSSEFWSRLLDAGRSGLDTQFNETDGLSTGCICHFRLWVNHYRDR